MNTRFPSPAITLCALATLIGCSVPDTRAQTQSSSSAFEGYGNISIGGAGGTVYHVTSLGDSGAGTLRNVIENMSGPRIVVFDVAGTITMQSTIALRNPYLTIDGSTAPSPGITVTQTAATMAQFVVCGTHDVIITHVRFKGLYGSGPQPANNQGILGIDGDSGPDHIAQRIILDHLTVRNSVDAGPDIWGEVADTTLSWCLVMYSWHPTTVSHYPAPYQVRQRISMHHNVYAKNNDRNPQLRADVRNFDMVNNVIYGWGYFDNQGQGTRVRNDTGEPKVNANIVNNYYVPVSNPSWALIYGIDPGSDATECRGTSNNPPQGTVLTNTCMGSLWVAGNVLPPENLDQYSTISAPLPVPSYAQVTTWPASQLKSTVLPGVGMKYRASDEQSVLTELSGKMTGAVLRCDYNGDGVVDALDMGHLMGCLTRPGVPQTDPTCTNTDLDGDLDVDQADFGLLQRCLTDGASVLDAGCYK